MAKFDSPITEVLHLISLDGIGETFGDVSTWGEIHFGIGRLTREELRGHFSAELAAAGITAEEFPEGSYWIVHEDNYGFVEATRFDDQRSYRAALDEIDRRWAEFGLSLV